jgi:hypothetical protein
MAPVLVQIHFFTFSLEVETGFWVVALPVPPSLLVHAYKKCPSRGQGRWFV